MTADVYQTRPQVSCAPAILMAQHGHPEGLRQGQAAGPASWATRLQQLPQALAWQGAKA